MWPGYPRAEAMISRSFFAGGQFVASLPLLQASRARPHENYLQTQWVTRMPRRALHLFRLASPSDCVTGRLGHLAGQRMLHLFRSTVVTLPPGRDMSAARALHLFVGGRLFPLMPWAYGRPSTSCSSL